MLTKPTHMHTASNFYIKGMVCQRCIDVVSKEFNTIGLAPVQISLGKVTMEAPLAEEHFQKIEGQLKSFGFDLLEDRKVKTVRDVKQLVTKVYSGNYDFPYSFRFSDLIQKELNRDYDVISSMFSEVMHKTLERYIINYRIGKVKEFLVYSSLTLSDIAFKLNFSSVAHLSRQFKEVTGINPSQFKQANTGRADN